MTDPFIPSSELAAIATRWLEYHAQRRNTATANLFSRSAAVTYIGSDEDEILTGAEFHDTFIAFFEDGVSLTPQNIKANGYQAGDFGWAWTTLTVDAPATGKTVKFRNSFIFALEDGVWRIVHVHNSNPKPNLEAMGYDTPSLDELAAAVRTERLDLGTTTGIASVMFTDIVDSTALTAAMGDTAWTRVVQDHFGQLARMVTDAGGRFVKSLGDGTLSTFPSASAAMQAAVAIQRNASSQKTEPRLSVRIGIHTGDVVKTEGDYLGTVVNKAARVAAAAEPDEIRLSDATRAMVGTGPDFEFSSPVHVALKGLEGQHTLYRLEWQA